MVDLLPELKKEALQTYKFYNPSTSIFILRVVAIVCYFIVHWLVPAVQTG
jgi:hypothetical protein